MQIRAQEFKFLHNILYLGWVFFVYSTSPEPEIIYVDMLALVWSVYQCRLLCIILNVSETGMVWFYNLMHLRLACTHFCNCAVHILQCVYVCLKSNFYCVKCTHTKYNIIVFSASVYRLEFGLLCHNLAEKQKQTKEDFIEMKIEAQLCS